MKFTILSHAGLSVDHNGIRLVCDPWLVGSCYWRSWWNFPEPDPALISNLEPQFIYLTHLHWDHFHGPSLRKLFSPQTTVIVPKVPTRRMLDDLRWLGFHDILEVPHGGALALGEDFTLHSYQFGLGVDSGVVVSGGGYTLFNCNDCKLFGLPLRQVLKDHPKIDFIFRSHSSASPVPHCIENHEQLLPAKDGAYDSAEQFALCAVHTGARYAIPFASNHCFLHPETRHYNATATTPEVARQRYAAIAAKAGRKTDCIVMPPGSSWSDIEGFAIMPFDFSQRESYVEEMSRRHAPQLQEQLERESQTAGDFAAFEEYFSKFLRSLPALVRRRLRPAVFRVVSANEPEYWLVDPRRQPTRLAQPLTGTLLFEVHAIVVNDCARLKMFSVWTASKRIKIRLPSADDLKHANLWFTLLDLYETDLLPLSKNLSLRSLSVRMRRWREPVELAQMLLRRTVLRRPLTLSTIYPLKST